MAGVKGQPTPGNPNIKNYGFGSGYRTKEQDDEYRKRPKPRIWTDEKIAEFIDEMLTLSKKILMEDKKINENAPAKLKQETIRDMNNMMNRLLQFKVQYYPPVQKNLNVNVDIAADAVIERLKNWKKQQVVEVENE